MSPTLSGLLQAAGIEAEVRGEADVSGLAYDSRHVGPGDLFACLPGHQTDGHRHAPEAVGKGAAALLVDHWLDLEAPQVRTQDVRRILGPLADAFWKHPSRDVTVAAVTGTNGKTTITYLLESIFSAAGKPPGVIGSISYRFAGQDMPASRTTPEAFDLHRLLAQMREAGVEAVALEATSDGLAQHRLGGVTILSAGFTNLTQDHLITHGSMESYFDAKALLFRDGYTRKAVINVDDPYGRRLLEEVKGELDVLTYGDGGDLAPVDVELGGRGTRFSSSSPAGYLEVTTHLVGRYNVSNCLCAIGLALQCGIDPSDAVEGVAGLESMPGRLERVEGGQPFSVLVDYAHTPDALAQALAAGRELGDGRLLVVFGCGGDRDRTKRPQMGEIATKLADLSFVTSDNPRGEDPEVIVREIEAGADRGGGTYRTVIDRRQAIGEALGEAQPGDVVLIAGKGHEQGQQIGDEVFPFDDRTVAQEILSAITEDASCAK